METRWIGEGAGAVLVVAVLSVACGGSKAPPPSAPPAVIAPKSGPTVRDEVHERIAPHTCAAKTKLAQLLGHTTPATDAPPEQESADSAPPPTSLSTTARLPANQAYRVVAPSTVLIRTERGMGTGVVIDAKGYVLTNYHVIADGSKKDFVISANVTFGELTPTGRMSKQEKSYDAVVVKADPVRDMAILKVKDPPRKLEAARLAKSAPQIAEKVISVGHAGIGFLWAAKTCSISSIGERQLDASMLAALNCNQSDPSLSADQATKQQQRCDEQKKEMSEALMSRTQGLALQTDCAITHGDSGGPLVNAAGEVVGLNQSIAADLATVAFHVHLDEIREFAATHGEDAIAILPDPYCDGGLNASLEDIDLDGVPDTVVNKGTASLLGGYDRMSLLIDLDQDQARAKKDPDAPFNAELALLVIRDTAYVWYDTDGDSRFDLLLVDKNNDGQPELAYRIDAEGRAKEDKEALPKHDFSAKLIKDPALHPRLGKIAAAVGGTKYTSAKVQAAASSVLTVPDPALGAGTQGRFLDSDGNGKADVAVMRGTFSRGILIDADEDSIASFKSGDSADETVKSKKVDAEIVVIAQGSSVWAIYDTDNDAKFDLALLTSNGTDPSSLLATGAWRLAGGGEMTPAPEHLGRKLLRPGLVASPRAAGALRVLGSDLAADEGLGSLPDPMPARGRYLAREVKGMPPATVVEGQSGATSIMLVDVNHDTKLPPKTDLQKVVSERKFDAEVAIVHRGGEGGGSDWIYYDTDTDGKFDLVFFVPGSSKEPTQAYRVAASPTAKGGTVLEPAKELVAGRPIRHKVFKDKAIAAKWKTIAGKMFKPASIEE